MNLFLRKINSGSFFFCCFVLNEGVFMKENMLQCIMGSQWFSGWLGPEFSGPLDESCLQAWTMSVVTRSASSKGKI